MTTHRDVAVFVGSLRRASYNRMMAKALVELAPRELRLEIVEIRDLSLYDQDLEDEPPAPWRALKDRIHRAEGVLFVTPEYNRSVPAVLKNAIDIASRPYRQSAWTGKPAGVVSVSMSALGGFGANHHLRQSLVYLNMPAMQQPEAYVGNAQMLFDDDGKLVNADTRAFMSDFLRAFAAWVEVHAKPRERSRAHPKDAAAPASR